MSEEHGTTFNPHPRRPGDDLSQEIAELVEKLPGDLVRCARVGDGKYRCNWWCVADAEGYDNPSMAGGQMGTAHRVRKSRYLLASRDAGGIVITEMAAG